MIGVAPLFLGAEAVLALIFWQGCRVASVCWLRNKSTNKSTQCKESRLLRPKEGEISIAPHRSKITEQNARRKFNDKVIRRLDVTNEVALFEYSLIQCLRDTCFSNSLSFYRHYSLNRSHVCLLVWFCAMVTVTYQCAASQPSL